MKRKLFDFGCICAGFLATGGVAVGISWATVWWLGWALAFLTGSGLFLFGDRIPRKTPKGRHHRNA